MQFRALKKVKDRYGRTSFQLVTAVKIKQELVLSPQSSRITAFLSAPFILQLPDVIAFIVPHPSFGRNAYSRGRLLDATETVELR